MFFGRMCKKGGGDFFIRRIQGKEGKKLVYNILLKQVQSSVVIYKHHTV